MDILTTSENRKWLSAQGARSQRKVLMYGHYIKYFSVLFFAWFLIGMFVVSADALESDSQPNEGEKIIGIESSSFFSALKKDYKEVFYVYFGRPTCLECIEFEKELRTFLDTSNWVIYYYNTTYWKDDPQYAAILSEYHVESVPMLVKICAGEYEASFNYDQSEDSVEIQKELGEFFPSLPDGALSVTEKGLPIQFHDRITAFILLLLFMNDVYLFAMKKELVQKKPRFILLFVFITSSVLVYLQGYIFSIGFSFTMAYEASPATDLLSRFGRLGYIVSWPLYLAICCLCIYIKGKQLEIRNS